MKSIGLVAIRPSAVVTMTVAAPAACAGVVTPIEDADSKPAVLVAVAPPMVTVLPLAVKLPLIVTPVPPPVEPVVGVISLIVGGEITCTSRTTSPPGGLAASPEPPEKSSSVPAVPAVTDPAEVEVTVPWRLVLRVRPASPDTDV